MGRHPVAVVNNFSLLAAILENRWVTLFLYVDTVSGTPSLDIAQNELLLVVTVFF
jgi:hypothetical protein